MSLINSMLSLERPIVKIEYNTDINPDLVFKSTYILDFLGLSGYFSEKDIHPHSKRRRRYFVIGRNNGKPGRKSNVYLRPQYRLRNRTVTGGRSDTTQFGQQLYLHQHNGKPYDCGNV